MRRILALLVLCAVAPAMASDVIPFFPNCKLLLPTSDSSTHRLDRFGRGDSFLDGSRFVSRLRLGRVLGASP